MEDNLSFKCVGNITNTQIPINLDNLFEIKKKSSIFEGIKKKKKYFLKLSLSIQTF